MISKAQKFPVIAADPARCTSLVADFVRAHQEAASSVFPCASPASCWNGHHARKALQCSEFGGLPGRGESTVRPKRWKLSWWLWCGLGVKPSGPLKARGLNFAI